MKKIFTTIDKGTVGGDYTVKIFWKRLKDGILKIIKTETITPVECIRCNDNGCPACDGTKGSKYNPEPY